MGRLTDANRAWTEGCSACVRDPDDAQLASLVNELSGQSEELRRLWARHDARRTDRLPRRCLPEGSMDEIHAAERPDSARRLRRW